MKGIANTAEAAQNWQKVRRADLYLVKTHNLWEPLERAGLTAQTAYFRQNTRRVQYQEFREQDYPLGSGTVECALNVSRTASPDLACAGRAQPPRRRCGSAPARGRGLTHRGHFYFG
jgi:hypothetical protein